MKVCHICAASNADTARFCSECAANITGSPNRAPTIPVAPSAGQRRKDTVGVEYRSPDLGERVRTMRSPRQADVLFVLDCTGSMQGEIDAIKDTIIGFANGIAADGVRARVGLIEFRDRLNGEEHRLLDFGGQPFTSDATLFRARVGALRASGGGDAPESSLDALLLAARQPFGVEANRVIVLVTDAPPHIPDKEAQTIEQVHAALRDAGVTQLYLIMRTGDRDSQVYLQLLEGLRGLAFELGNGDDFRSRAEDFKRTLRQLGKTISTSTR